MATKEQIIQEIKAENPTLRAGSDEDGYVELTEAEYEATVADWANAKLAKQEKLLHLEAEKQAKVNLLAKLGITSDEAKLLLS